jgi:GGDEF domain-containing protein
MESVLNAVDTLCLWNDSEFAFLHECPDADANARAIAARLQQQLRAPVVDGGNEMFLTTSIGVVTGVRGSEQAEDIVSLASTAAARARNAGVGRIEVVDMGGGAATSSTDTAKSGLSEVR